MGKEASLKSGSSHSQQVSRFHKNLKGAQGEVVERLASLSLAPSPSSPGRVELLKEISEEQKFEVTYVDIEEVSKSGRMQCLVLKIDMPVKQLHPCTFQV